MPVDRTEINEAIALAKKKRTLTMWMFWACFVIGMFLVNVSYQNPETGEVQLVSGWIRWFLVGMTFLWYMTFREDDARVARIEDLKKKGWRYV